MSPWVTVTPGLEAVEPRVRTLKPVSQQSFPDCHQGHWGFKVITQGPWPQGVSLLVVGYTQKPAPSFRHQAIKKADGLSYFPTEKQRPESHQEGTARSGGPSSISHRKSLGKIYSLLPRRRDHSQAGSGCVSLRARAIPLRVSPDSGQLLLSLCFDPSGSCFVLFLPIQHLTFSLPSRLKSPPLLCP